MNKILFSLLLAGSFATPITAWSQTAEPEPVDYTEQVVVEGAGRAFLHARALDWVQHKFTYSPTSALVTEPATGLVRITGTGTLKPVDARGQDQTLKILFTFRFQATDNGYTYHVSSFQVVPDPQIPSQQVPFEQYRAELKAIRTNEKTHNDRRLTAQANSLASDAALSFRSFMNSQPPEEQVGVAGEQQAAQ